MPVTSGLRDEENERISNIMKKLMALEYFPENQYAFENELAGLALNQETLFSLTGDEMVGHLKKLHFDWVNAEIFGDFLVKMELNPLAKAVYEYVQSDSKMFSFGIFNKIANLKASEDT